MKQELMQWWKMLVLLHCSRTLVHFVLNSHQVNQCYCGTYRRHILTVFTGINLQDGMHHELMLISGSPEFCHCVEWSS